MHMIIWTVGHKAKLNDLYGNAKYDWEGGVELFPHFVKTCKITHSHAEMLHDPDSFYLRVWDIFGIVWVLG